MGLSPFKIGDGRPWVGQQFTTDSGVFPLVGVENASISMHIQDANNDVLLYVCTGTWEVTDAVNGIATFTPSQQDLTTGPLGKPGLFRIYPVVTLATGPVPMDAQLLRIISSP